MRASKLRLPDSTAAHTRSLLVMTSLSSGVRSPAFANAGGAAVARQQNPAFSPGTARFA